MFSYERSPEASKTGLEFHTHVLLRNTYFVCGFHPHTCKMPDTPQVERNRKTKGIYWLTSSLLLISLPIMFVFILLVRIGLHSDHEMQDIMGIRTFLSFFSGQLGPLERIYYLVSCRRWGKWISGRQLTLCAIIGTSNKKNLRIHICQFTVGLTYTYVCMYVIVSFFTFLLFLLMIDPYLVS